MNILEWIQEGDPSLKYLVQRDLLNRDDRNHQNEIGKTGWCAEYLRSRNPDSDWGRKFYQPKWICTHYTICELRNLEYRLTDPLLLKEINRIGIDEKAKDGGINPAVSIETSDTCVTAMYLNYAAYYGADIEILKRVVDFILNQRMSDGGYNCNFNHTGAVHSSLHTSISVLESFQTYISRGFTYRIKEIRQSAESIVEFILEHRLFRSSRTGEVIDPKMLIMTYPFRWKYTILRALNAFVDFDVEYDKRMEGALTIIEKKRLPDTTWKMQANYPGEIHFRMEEPGKPGRMITYLCLKILKTYRDFNPATLPV